jgi:hypothetical protein
LREEFSARRNAIALNCKLMERKLGWGLWRSLGRVQNGSINKDDLTVHIHFFNDLNRKLKTACLIIPVDDFSSL